jgi:hypothetical protein
VAVDAAAVADADAPSDLPTGRPPDLPGRASR